MTRLALLERLAAEASSPSVAAFLRGEADKVRHGVSGDAKLTRIASTAFYTPELDAAIAASVCPPDGVIASMAGVRTYWDGKAQCFSHPIRDAELRAERRAAVRERAFAARSARLAALEAQPWFPAWKASKIAAGEWVDFGSGEVVGR